MRPEDRGRAVTEASGRVVNCELERAAARPGWLEHVVSDTLYHELRRLEGARRSDPRRADDSRFYRDLQRRLQHMNERQHAHALRQMAERFAEEVAGTFDERVYRLSTSVLPAGLSLMLKAVHPTRVGSAHELIDGLSERVLIQGASEAVVELSRLGTLVVVPTHSSHLDSVVLGYAVHRLGLPPLLYGAGLNLFQNPLVSYFMNHLGAYRVDRKKQATLYKDVLKEYATVALEYGYHNLFFPGGTRSRSGAVESKLKRGLLGTAITAYVNNLKAVKKQPRLFVAPCTISYQLVLEAETLIDDYLKETGKARYIIEDDEATKLSRVASFLSSLMSMDSRVVITFSEPMDVLGNGLDAQGESRDPRGRRIDLSRFVAVGGAPEHDVQRDAQYTSELASAIAGCFRRDNVVMSTHLVAAALLGLLQRKNPDLDLYRLLRTGGETPSFPLEELCVECERVLAALRGAAIRPRLSPELEQRDARQIVAGALRYFGTYHTRPAAVRRGNQIQHEDRTLLYYYANRLRGYGLPGVLGGTR